MTVSTAPVRSTSRATRARRLPSLRSVASTDGLDRLDIPATGRGAILPRRVDREAVGRIAELIARFLGTAHYLAIQTVLVIVWIALNIAVSTLRWDPYPFILLNLAFSTQAAYAAPLILLAQNRQDDRERIALAEDRAAATRVREDTEFLAREVAALRIAHSHTATRQYVRGEMGHQLDDLREDLERMLRRILAEGPAEPPGAAVVPLPPDDPLPPDGAPRGHNAMV
jgi:uncharacterized membrane protein